MDSLSSTITRWTFLEQAAWDETEGLLSQKKGVVGHRFAVLANGTTLSATGSAVTLANALTLRGTKFLSFPAEKSGFGSQ